MGKRRSLEEGRSTRSKRQALHVKLIKEITVASRMAWVMSSATRVPQGRGSTR
jgi:hypothetical protein